MNYNVDERGFYGEFGGAFIPEMMYSNIKELRDNYLRISGKNSLDFYGIMQEGHLRYFIQSGFRSFMVQLFISSVKTLIIPELIK